MMPEARTMRNLEPPNTYDPDRRGNKLLYNGGFWISEGQPCNGHYTFVVLPPQNPFNDNLLDHVGRSIDVWISKDLHHDYLALGADVHYAGTVDFVNGQITIWNNQSGHYQPLAIYLDQAPSGFTAGLCQVVLNNGSLAPIRLDGTVVPRQ